MYKVSVKHNKNNSFLAKSGEYEFTIDSKGQTGITPPDTLLASLASCIGVYIHKYSEGAKLGLEGFEVFAEAEFAKEAPLSFKEIKVTIDLKGVILDERRSNSLLNFIRNCPVHNTIEGSPKIEMNLIHGN
jgi:uncharacterized OsmC-like protein